MTAFAIRPPFLPLLFLASLVPAAVAKPLTLRLAGPWVKIAGRPPLEQWASPKAEPVNFTVFQAAGGCWQLIACIRHTTHPGNSRLLYWWSSDTLTAPDWKPGGIFLSSRADWNHREGHLQAPFHAKDAGTHFLFYNSNGAHLLTSADGLAWEPYGQEAVFPMGRDVCLLDDRTRSGKWIAHNTSPEPGINPATRDHTIRARASAALTGPWKETATEIPPLTPPPAGYTFAYAESPFVLHRGGHYFRFEQMYVFRSTDPLRWEGPPITCLMPESPMKLLAPEIVIHESRDYLLAYQWRNNDERGVFLAPLAWN